jgi:hypothetical protein
LFAKGTEGYIGVKNMPVEKQAAAEEGRALSRAVKSLSRDSKWELIETVALKFPSGHPQGMVKVGNNFYVSTVEVTTAPRRYPEPRDGYDQDTGAGNGFLLSGCRPLNTARIAPAVFTG